MPWGIQDTPAGQAQEIWGTQGPSGKPGGTIVGNHMGLSLSECYKTFVKPGHLSLRGKGFKGCSHQCGTGAGAPSNFPSCVYPPVICLVLPLAFSGPLSQGRREWQEFSALLFNKIGTEKVQYQPRGGWGLMAVRKGQGRRMETSTSGSRSPLWHFVHLNQHLFCLPQRALVLSPAAQLAVFRPQASMSPSDMMWEDIWHLPHHGLHTLWIYPPSFVVLGESGILKMGFSCFYVKSIPQVKLQAGTLGRF